MIADWCAENNTTNWVAGLTFVMEQTNRRPRSKSISLFVQQMGQQAFLVPKVMFTVTVLVLVWALEEGQTVNAKRLDLNAIVYVILKMPNVNERGFYSKKTAFCYFLTFSLLFKFVIAHLMENKHRKCTLYRPKSSKVHIRCVMLTTVHFRYDIII